MGTDWVGFLSVCLSLSASGWLVGFFVRLTVKENFVFAEAGGVVFGFDWVGFLSVCRRVHSFCARVDVTQRKR